MSKIKNLKVSELLEEVASKSPTPGGGSVAALSGAMAASLVAMVANLTIGKKKYESKEKRMKTILKETLVCQKELLRLADEDSKAFEKVMSAYRSKKGIRAALRYAIDVPTKTAKASEKVIALAEEVAKIGNKNAVSDAKTAKHLAKAAIKGADENIKINREAIASLG